MIKEYLGFVLKGMAMGIANVIPGVSGGTIALITGIFERLINAIKSFDLKAIKLLMGGKFKEFFDYTDLGFIIAVFAGVGLAIILIARLFEYLFAQYPVYIWSFFFGLILASVFFVGRTIERWRLSVVITFVLGTALALLFTFLTPAGENDSFWYLVICGVVAICSMILPGLSGSFVLILMGNYQLVAIDAINNMRFDVLIPVAIGAAGGLVAFSHFLSWLFKKYKDQTIAALTGFILGSLGIIWPWKDEIIKKFGEKEKVIGYVFHWPEINLEFFIALGIMIIGVVSIWLMEKSAAGIEKNELN
jgi:putative membrane protein